MKFTLELTCNNAAFDPSPQWEIKRLLAKAACLVDCGRTDGMLLDLNGNRVGSFELVEDDEC